MDKLYIVIPAYNERENIEKVLQDWYPIVERYSGEGQSRLVIINDGSKDDTYEILCKLVKNYPLLVPLNKANEGHGATVLFGYNYAIENVVCFLLFIIFGVRVSDANAPFRLMRTDIVKKYINKLPKNFNLPNIMFTTYFVYNKEKVKFIDITFKPRQAGKNSINIRKIIKIGWKAIIDFMKLRKEINN